MPYPYSCPMEYKGGIKLTKTVKNTRLLPYRKRSLFDKIRFSFSVCLFLFFFLVPVNAYASLGGYECYNLYQEITDEFMATNSIMNKAFEFASISPFQIIEKITTNKAVVENLKLASKSLSITIATLLLCIDFFKKSVNFEWSRSWENILLFIVKAIVIKVLVQNSDNIIEAVYQGFNYINVEVLKNTKDSFEFLPVGDMQQYLIEAPKESDGNSVDVLFNWATYILFDSAQTYEYNISRESVHFLHPEFYVPEGGRYSIFKFMEEVVGNINYQIFPLITLLFDEIYFLIMKAVAALVFVQVVGRAFELTVYTLLAPLPLATFASEVNCDVAKNFLKKYIACILQLTVIVVMLLAYEGLREFTPDGLLGVVAFITLGIGVMRSGQWARNICGTN